MARKRKASQPIGGTPYGGVGTPTDSLRQKQQFFKVWANATELARMKMGRDYQYAEGNGKQWSNADRNKVIKQNRPVLEFNQILPQLEFICGMQRDMQMDFKAYPRHFNDIRLSEITNAVLKAAMDFGRIHRTTDRVFDDGMITGLGVWEVLHNLEDAEDLVWGDIEVNRIHPQAFIYDPWAAKFDLQDGQVMGKASWMALSDFKDKHPQFAHLATPGEWLSRSSNMIGASDDLGTGINLIPELWDQESGRIRILTMWCKEAVNIILLVDERTGECKEFNSTDDAELYKQYLATTAGSNISQSMQVVSTGATAIFANPMGQPIYDPATGAPMEFANSEMANMALNSLAQKVGMQATEGIQVIKRVAKKPYWTEMVYWQELASGPSPYKDRNYPFVPYISRRWADDPDSIFGIVRNLWDPQDEYNKRYSNLLAHVNSSAHSGWLNRKVGGANRQELELMGSKPGVVVEYAVEKPMQIQPTQLPPGHFAMIEMGEKNILRISSVNAEMVGQTTQQTVSGRAIKARQAGGSVGLKPRFRTFEESNLDLVRMVFSRIQQFWPVEKIRRIIGVAEMSFPMGPGGQPLFMAPDPVNPGMNMPVPEDEILKFLKNVVNTEFDIVFGLQDSSETARAAMFDQAMQLTQMVSATGRPVGPATLNALVEMSDMPSKLATGLKMDMLMPLTMAPAGGGQPGQPGQAGPAKPANGDGASSGGGGGGSTPGKQQAAQQREKSSGGGF